MHELVATLASLGELLLILTMTALLSFVTGTVALKVPSREWWWEWNCVRLTEDRIYITILASMIGFIVLFIIAMLQMHIVEPIIHLTQAGH